jgi:hypothetical protein
MRVEEVPERIVVDGSLGLKWVLIEEHSDRAMALGPGRELLSSALFWAETADRRFRAAVAQHPSLADRMLLLRDIVLH